MCFGLKYLHCCTYVLEQRAKAVALFLQYAAPQQQGLGFSFFYRWLGQLGGEASILFCSVSFWQTRWFCSVYARNQGNKGKGGDGRRGASFFLLLPVCLFCMGNRGLHCLQSLRPPPPAFALPSDSIPSYMSEDKVEEFETFLCPTYHAAGSP